MKCSHAVNIAFIYLRLSNEDQRLGESGSITNQRKILEDYCSGNGIVIAREFVDDDWSGGNFNRPGFQSMIKALQADKRVNMILTKDLSRLGRDMSESSYYAERLKKMAPMQIGKFGYVQFVNKFLNSVKVTMMYFSTSGNNVTTMQ